MQLSPNQEQEQLIQNTFEITDKELMELTNKYLQRENGDDDINYFLEKGGHVWLQQGLKTDFEKGIDSATLDARNAQFGNNVKKQVKTKSFWQLAWEAFDDLILKILMVAGIASIIINMIMEEEERSTAWIEGFAIIMAVLIVVFVTAYNDLKKEKEFQKLSEEAESGKKIILIRNGVTDNEAKIQDVMVGDLIGLQGGMEIPGDAVVINANQLEIDESAMTGETLAMKKNHIEYIVKEREKKLSQNAKLGHSSLASNILLAGTTVQCGTGNAIIINVGKNSAIGKIQEKLIAGEEESTPLQLKLEKIARDIGFFGLGAAILIFIVLIIRMIIEESQNGWDESAGDYLGEILEYFLISIAILVVAIPEGLPLAVTLSLAFSVDKMAKENNLVRRMQACETMGGANIICSDKTGTLTRNEMYWTDFYNNKNVKIFDSEQNKALPYQEITTDQTKSFFLNTVILNSDEDPKQKSGNPTEMALLKYIDQNDIDVLEFRSGFDKPLFQAPFTSSRKRMSKIIQLENGDQYIYMKGASEYMLQCSDKILNLETGQEEPLDSNKKKEINDAIISMAKNALRTIGLCYQKVNINQLDLTENGKDEHGIFEYEKQNFILLGIAGIKDIIRPEVPKSMRQCEVAGIDVKMVTGDNKITARAIAEEIGLISERTRDTAIVLEGPEFYRLIGGIICKNCNSDENCTCVNNEYELQEQGNKGKKIRIDTIQNGAEFDKIWKNLKVLARSRPEDKYALVVGLRERNNVVAVTGDGTNDAPALKKADVGFAMAIAGTEVAKQAADIQILDDNFASIIVAVKWGRNIYDSIRKFLQFQLTVNVVAVITTFVAAAILQEAIFSPVQMLWINLIMDTLAALALATEPPSEELLYRKPYARTEYIISPIMMKHILGQAVFQCTVIFIVVFLGERFLFDVIGQRQIRTGNLIVSGRSNSGYDRDEYDGQYSSFG